MDKIVLDVESEHFQGKTVPLTMVLRAFAGQENCDSEEYDAMQKAAELIDQLVNRLGQINEWALSVPTGTWAMTQQIEKLIELSDIITDGEPLTARDHALIEDGLDKINAVKPRLDPEVEAKAEVIYNEEFKDQEGWVPWTVGGNSVMQDKARSIARARISNGKIFYAASVTSGNSHD